MPNPFLPQGPIPHPASPPGQLSQLPSIDFSTMFAPLKVTKERQYFLGQTINLDGQRFVECRFDHCILITNTGDIFLQNCVFGDGNAVQFGEHTKKIVQLVTLLDPNMASPALFANVQQVGPIRTISII